MDESTNQNLPKREKRSNLAFYRLVFTGLLTASFAAFIQILQIQCTREPGVGALFCLDWPLTASIFCFAIAIPLLTTTILAFSYTFDAESVEPVRWSLPP